MVCVVFVEVAVFVGEVSVSVSVPVSVLVGSVIRVSVTVGSDINVSETLSVMEPDSVAVQNPSSPQVAMSVQHSSVQHVCPSRQAPPSQQISVSAS
jgi:hypothetical protein